MYVPPIDIHGAFNTLENEYMGPVPAEETLSTDVPNAALAACLTVVTNGSETVVLDAGSP